MTKRAPVGTGPSGSQGLLEREAELGAVDELLAAARGSNGRLLLVEGHAGIGKSALLDAAVTRALDAGATVLRARAAELESAFAFGVAVQLFEALLAGADDETRDRLLAGSAALAGPLLERPTSWAGDEAADRSYGVMHGLFWLLSNLADRGPVLLVVDDVHWADRASLRLVLYLLQRLDGMAAAIAIARRLGEPGAPDDLLGQIAAHPACRRLRPAPLSRAGAGQMVDAALPGADEAFAEACWRMTEGNAFLLGELLRAVAAKGWSPTAQNASQIGTLAPDAVLRAVAVRLMRLSDDAAGVARAVAVLGDDARLRHVAALTGRAPDRVAAAAGALAASDILRPFDGGVLRFAHPLLASAVYADVGPGERAELHRRSAAILHGEEVAPERVAAHLLPSSGTGEPWVVAVLAAAADRALELGAPESAAEYLRRALDEPPEHAARGVLLGRLGACESAIGLPTAVGRLRDALAAADGDGERARTLLALGRALTADGQRAEALQAFEAATSGPDADLSAQAAAEADALCALDVAHGRAARAADVPLEATPSGPEAPTASDAGTSRRALLATRSLRLALCASPREEVLAVARRALEEDAWLAELGAGSSVPVALCMALESVDELAWQERVATGLMARARIHGSVSSLATASVCRAAARWGQGRLADALADAQSALDAERSCWGHLLPAAVGIVAGVLVDLGELDEAATLAARLDHTADGQRSRLFAPLHEALGRLALAERRDRAALAHFDAWRDAVAGIANPACRAGWRSACAYPLVTLGRADEAAALAREELALARAYGAPRAISVALRGLAHARPQDDLDGSVAMLEEAVATVAPSQARLEHCRAQLELGAVLRRAGRRADAGRALGEALELARSCGARPLEERAGAELEVAGARVRRAARRGVDALSPSERRVVMLAVEGLSNREIAEALFVTRKAVEWHLGNAYRKLDVRSRRELPAAIGATQPPADAATRQER